MPKHNGRREMRLVCLCKDCMWWEKEKDSAQGKCRRYFHYPTGAWFCASGMTEKERRESIAEQERIRQMRAEQEET